MIIMIFQNFVIEAENMDSQGTCLSLIITDTANITASIDELPHLRNCSDGISELQKVMGKEFNYAVPVVKSFLQTESVYCMEYGILQYIIL